MQKQTHNSKRRVFTSRTHGERREHPRVEVSAGGIVFTRSPRGIFFAMLKDSYGKWTFPKGHVMRGEKYEEAAKREVGEEMGIFNTSLIMPLGHIDIWFRDRFVFKGKLIHKYIHYYLFEVKEHARLERPEIIEGGERIQAVAWVEARDAVRRSNYKDMRPILERAFRHLKIDMRPQQGGVRPAQTGGRPQQGRGANGKRWHKRPQQGRAPQGSAQRSAAPQNRPQASGQQGQK